MALLAETYAHPVYLGVKGARQILLYLNKILALKVNVEKLEQDIEDIEEELIKKTKDLEDVSKQAALKKLKSKTEVSYIG